MSALREGGRLARAIGQVRLPLRPLHPCGRRSVSTGVDEAEAPKLGHLADLESTTTFTSSEPDQEAIDAFDSATKSSARERRLPGSRYVNR